jgi:DNA polymerase III subunit epsilon
VRQVVLDTETTGLEPSQGHRIIEIGCVELVNRRLTGNRYHQYVQPDREIDAAAVEIHGITNEFLADKPRFGEIAGDFLAFVQGSELIIHNAPFDVGFINHELDLMGGGHGSVGDYCSVLDTLEHARRLHPGQRNNLDALCKRYGIDNSQRELHGALLDAEILADVYLAMTGGQVSLSLEGMRDTGSAGLAVAARLSTDRPRLRVVQADVDEVAAHHRYLLMMAENNGGVCLWERLQAGEGDAGH